MTQPAWHFRPARASDADACARLTFDSGPAEMRFFLPGESDERCIAFLRFAFASDRGMFSWRHHYVACAPDDTVLAEMSVYDYRNTRFDNLHLIRILLRFFGLLKTFKILQHGMLIEREQPPPQRGQVLLRSYSIDKHAQGSSIGRMMFARAIISGWLRLTPGDQYLLNVRQDNRVRHLYERIGFVAQPRQHPPPARLPAELVSVRMVWSSQGMASACARIKRLCALLMQEQAAAQDEELHRWLDGNQVDDRVS
jgi:hypothetical protein